MFVRKQTRKFCFLNLIKKRVYMEGARMQRVGLELLSGSSWRTKQFLHLVSEIFTVAATLKLLACLFSDQ